MYSRTRELDFWQYPIPFCAVHGSGIVFPISRLRSGSSDSIGGSTAIPGGVSKDELEVFGVAYLFENVLVQDECLIQLVLRRRLDFIRSVLSSSISSSM